MAPQKQFKLLHLPYLAQREIWKSLSYQEIMFLSLCSSRVYNSMKLTKVYVDRIVYEDDVEMLRATIAIKNKTPQQIFAIRPVLRFEQGSEVMRLKIGGIDVECIWEKYGIVINDSKRDEIQSAIDKHLHELFRTSTVNLKLSGDNVAQNKYPNIRNVTNLGVQMNDMGIDLLDPILEKYPNRESLNVGWRYQGDIRLESKLFEIDDIRIDWSAHNSSILLDNFTGRCITLDNTNLDEIAVIRFLDAWILGQKYRKLKSCHLFINRESTGFDMQKVLNMYRERAKSWDRPTNDHFRSSRAVMFSTSTFDIMLFYEGHTLNIERDTDGKKATFTILRNVFCFCVWD